MSTPRSAPQIIWADAHNHLHDPRIAIDSGRGGEFPCLVNATSEDDWQDVLQTCDAHPATRHAALGVHPWFAHLVRPGWESRLRDHLATRPNLAIGECGLDRKTRACGLNVQTPVFEIQLRLAVEFQHPLVIHCVAAWGALFESLARITPPPSWMVHGFAGTLETAHRLIAMGAYLSIPVRALHPQGAKILDVFRNLPRERILLETDAPNASLPPAIHDASPNALPAHLPVIGSALANQLGRTPSSLAASTCLNFKRFLRLDSIN